CSLRGVSGPGACHREPDAFWYLGYRFRPDVQGLRLSTSVSRDAHAAAAGVGAHLPVVAYLPEHNTASAVVARTHALPMIHQAPDAGNPDSATVRLVVADRKLPPDQLEATPS